MAPKFDERGIPMQFRDQRLLMIELDKFPVKCKYLLAIHIIITSQRRY